MHGVCWWLLKVDTARARLQLSGHGAECKQLTVFNADYKLVIIYNLTYLRRLQQALGVCVYCFVLKKALIRRVGIKR